MSNLNYSIKDLENFTQIKAHTIRIWEQRYGLLEPKRSTTNIRYYSEDDLKKILNIKLLYNSGVKISKIASFSSSQLIQEAKTQIQEAEIDNQSEVDKLILLILDFEGRRIRDFLELKLKSSSFESIYESIIIPLLKKLGELWQVNTINITHEHYFSTILRDFVIYQIEAIQTPSKSEKTALLFLHDNEEHEFSLLLYQFILKQHGYICHNFGQKVPVSEIMDTFSQIQPQIVVSTFTAKISQKGFEKVETVLKEMSKKSQVIVSGNQLNKLEANLSKNIQHINSISQLKSLLE